MPFIRLDTVHIDEPPDPLIQPASVADRGAVWLRTEIVGIVTGVNSDAGVDHADFARVDLHPPDPDDFIVVREAPEKLVARIEEVEAAGSVTVEVDRGGRLRIPARTGMR